MINETSCVTLYTVYDFSKSLVVRSNSGAGFIISDVMYPITILLSKVWNMSDKGMIF